MSKAHFFVAIIISALIISCNSNQKTGNFKLFPLPQEFEVLGISGLKYDNIQQYFTINNADLPICGDLLKNIQAAETESKAQIIFNVDNSLDIKNEGYVLEI